MGRRIRKRSENKDNTGESSSLADELKQESDKLRQLAEQLKAREETLSEMEASNAHFRQFVYAMVRKEFERTLGELPDKDLEILANEEGAQPLEAFIDELERMGKGL